MPGVWHSRSDAALGGLRPEVSRPEHPEKMRQTSKLSRRPEDRILDHQAGVL
jgi:hypothetical protein